MRAAFNVLKLEHVVVSFQALIGRTSDSGKRKQELADDTEESGVVDVKNNGV